MMSLEASDVLASRVFAKSLRLRRNPKPFRWLLSPVTWESEPCHRATSPNTPTSRNARPTTSPKATRRGASPEKEAERRAWATVNKDDGGGKKPGGSGRGKVTGHPAAHKGGKKGGKAAASRSAADRSASAKKAAATRKRNAEHRAG